MISFFSLLFLAAPRSLFALAASPTGAPSMATPTPARAAIYREIGELKLKIAHNPATAASSRNKLARLYLQVGEPEKAVSLYRYALITDSSRAAAYHRRIGDIYASLGRDQEAAREYQSADESDRPTAAARSRQQLKEWEKAGRDDLLLQQYRFLFWTGSGSRIPYLRKIARLLSRKGEEDEALRYYEWIVRDYRQRIQDRPSRALDYTLQIGDLYVERGDMKSAEREYASAVAIEGKDGAKALLRQADFYRSRGDLPKALSLYREAEERKGVDPVAVRVKTAGILEDSGETDSALDWMEKASASAPPGKKRAAVRMKIARFLDRHEQPERALEAYRAALPDLDPLSRAGVMEEIGDKLSELGRTAEATDAYLKAIALWEDKQGKESDLRVLERLNRLAEKAQRRELIEKYTRRLISACLRLLSEDPVRAPYYHRQLGTLYDSLRQYPEALAQYRAWSVLTPEDPTPVYRLYRLYRDQFSDQKNADLSYARYQELRKRRSAEKSNQKTP